jgi:hypothetical protein
LGKGGSALNSSVALNNKLAQLCRGSKNTAAREFFRFYLTLEDINFQSTTEKISCELGGYGKSFEFPPAGRIIDKALLVMGSNRNYFILKTALDAKEEHRSLAKAINCAVADLPFTTHLKKYWGLE